jgi:hypothetical protein
MLGRGATLKMILGHLGYPDNVCYYTFKHRQ